MNPTTSQRKPYGLFILITAGIFLLQSCVSHRIYNKNQSEKDIETTSEDDNNPFYIAPFQTSAEKVWDLIHTDLALNIHFDSSSIDGYATLTLKPHFYSQDSLVLDAVNMEIYEVLTHFEENKSGVNGSNVFIPPPTRLKFNYRQNKKLVVYFNEVTTPNQPVSIRIQYSATPGKKIPLSYEAWASQNPEKVGGNEKDSIWFNTEYEPISDDIGMYFINADGKNPTKPTQMWTQGEPQSNCHWFPTLDAPNQKHTQRISITFPGKMQSLSNGKLTSSVDMYGNNGIHLRTDVWVQNKPHAPYLTMLAVGNWVRVKDSLPWPIDPNLRKKETLPIEYLVEPQFKDDAKMIFGNTPEMIQFFSQYTGVKYPWDKYSQVVVRDFVSGAMENTSATVHMEQLQHDKYDHIDDTYEDYISHELFHQWFGDYVTAENWSDLTLNESFATYGEYLWREFKYGKSNANEWLYSTEKSIYNPNKNNPLLNHHYTNINQQFDGVRYQKGACILHLLRQFIGDDAFRTSMKQYLETFAFKSAEVDDWRQIIEEVTGMDMKPFFNVWYKSDIAKANLSIGLKTIQSGNQDSSSLPPNINYSITASFGPQKPARNSSLGRNEENAYQQYFQPGFKIRVNYVTNGQAHQIEIPLGFCDGEHAISVGNIRPTQIVVDPTVYLPLVQIQYAIPHISETPRSTELYEMFLAAVGYSADVIREKSKSIRAVNLSHNYDFATVPTKPNDPTSVINLARITNRQSHPGNSQTSSLTDTSFTRPMLIDVIETLLVSNDNSCVLIGIELLNSLGRHGIALGGAYPLYKTSNSVDGSLDQPTIDRMRKILLQQSNNPLLESKTQCYLLKYLFNCPFLEIQIIGTDKATKPTIPGKVNASEAEKIWMMRNTESPIKLGLILDYLGSPISNPNNKNEMGFGVFQRDPWQAWTQEMINAQSPKHRLIWADAISQRILNIEEYYFDFSGTLETQIVNKLSDEAKLAEWKSFTLVVITKGQLDFASAIEFLHEGDYENPILDSLLCPILWANMKQIADIEKTTQSDPKIYQTWLTALRWCTRKQYDALITMENVAKDLGLKLSEQDYRTNGYSMAMLNCLKEIHNQVVVPKL
ncbi:MAG: M1 family metallopeptidase [Bacteroidetes bacterium]|nr:M1 family metallopeptidase [Bacteroidota bacterium]